jgi:hypothetical protein
MVVWPLLSIWHEAARKRMAETSGGPFWTATPYVTRRSELVYVSPGPKLRPEMTTCSPPRVSARTEPTPAKL